MDKLIHKFRGIKAYEEELAEKSSDDKQNFQKSPNIAAEDMDPKLKLKSNEKRLKSLKEKLDFDKRQQLLVKESINFEKRVNKRIVFDNKIDCISGKEDNEKSKPKAKQLFESDSEDEDIDGNDDKSGRNEIESDFNKKLNDKNAEKLIELNSRFAHDSRFRIDGRFLDQREDNNEREEEMNEKEKNLNLLEEVLGKKFKPIIKIDKNNENFVVNRKGLFVSRFDPNDKNSFEYELNTSNKNSKKVSFDQKVLDKELEIKRPIVSNEVYYEVSSELKDSLSQKDNEFSLTQMFGTVSSSGDNNDDINDNQKAEPIKYKTDKRIDKSSNPFRYDSSSSDEEKDIEIKLKTKTIDNSKQVLNSYRYFFDKNDSRFDEDIFYNKELIEKAKNNSKERELLIIRSMAIRKRSAIKNKKSDQKKNFRSKNSHNFKRFKSS